MTNKQQQKLETILKEKIVEAVMKAVDEMVAQINTTAKKQGEINEDSR
jgi:hypothetical protein